MKVITLNDVKRDIENQIDSFCSTLQKDLPFYLSNRWLDMIDEEAGYKIYSIYLRIRIYSERRIVTLANISFSERFQKQGLFKHTLSILERQLVNEVIIENVLNRNILRTLYRAGYELKPGSDPDRTFIKYVR